MPAHTLHARLISDLQQNGGILSEGGVRSVCSRETIVVLESVLDDVSAGKTLVFHDPKDVIVARRTGEVMPALVRAQVYLEQGLHVAGYVSYEAGPAFLPVPEREPSDEPPYLLWFGVFSDPIIVRRGTGMPPSPPIGGYTIGQVEPGIREAEYHAALHTIRKYLENGHTYQVNYTFPFTGRWSGTLADLYLRLRANQPVSYGSIIRHDGMSILSFSPELFFSVRGTTITMKPMKGTAPRGRYAEEDEAKVAWLRSSEKDRAENRMIVDLLRNDLGKIAEAGSVKVRSFFDIEKYASILQATSTITARLRRPPALVDLFHALFPSGSVTGAPKIETMKIIHEVEKVRRGPYTGAIGYASPSGESVFNVAIRTVQADQTSGRFTLHVGSGVTIASDASHEFEECRQKALFVSREPTVFSLFETIRWSPQAGFAHLRDHLSRMKRSARYFGRPFSLQEAESFLLQAEKQIRKEARSVMRVRLSVDGSGEFSVHTAALDDIEEPVLGGFSRRTISTEDRFQYHKTTHRPVYDVVLEDARSRGWFDAIVLNERKEVAEGARTNIFIERDGILLTPPVSAGILPGTMRERILASKDRKAKVQTLTVQDVLEADAVYFANALRGLLRVELVT